METGPDIEKLELKKLERIKVTDMAKDGINLSGQGLFHI
jgi:hypothetical protein